MRKDVKSITGRFLLMLLLASLFLFELHASSIIMESSGSAPAHSQSFLSCTSTGLLCPIRVPEKVSFHEETSSDWGHWNGKKAEQITILQLFGLLLFFALLCLTSISSCIPQSTNLPHIRILHFIHRTDGKGPGKPLFFH